MQNDPPSPREETPAGALSPDDLVPVEVWRLAVSSREGEDSVVILKESHGESLLPIAVGYCEAMGIDRAVEGRTGRFPLRPLTHELLVVLTGRLRARIERGIITRLDQGTFFAALVIGHAGGEEHVDARPSDVIAATLESGSVLYAARSLLESDD